MKPRILVIDDNSSIINDYRKILAPDNDTGVLDDLEAVLFGTPTSPSNQLECEIFTANQGEEGVAIFKEERLINPFDVVFVDMRMPPGWDGMRTIREIWNLQPDQFVVLCSAYSDYSFASLRDALGNKPNFLILNKPFSPEEILQIVHSVASKESGVKRAERKMAADLRVALNKNQLSTVYQPLVQLSTGQVIGFETLCRWEVEGKTVAYPDQFIDVAERYGLIGEVGEFAITEAVTMALSLIGGWTDHSFPLVTVNVAPKQLSHSFVAFLDSVVQEADLPVEALGIEITESGDLSAEEECIGIIEEIQSIGYHILLDDFGTGHSCLANLARVPFDTVKLDRNFCMSLPECQSSTLLLEAFGKLVRQLGKLSLVEGVETQIQEQIVRDFHFTVGQGYLYSKPVARERAIEMFFESHSSKTLRAA
ncbi:MAG: EAL domain-containing protein [Armatimonadota bacterium]